MSATRRWLPLLGLGAVLVAGLAVRVALAGWAPMFLEGDSQSYLLPGWELAQGEGFSPELRRAPVYPAFIAAVFRLLGPDLQTLALAQHFTGLLTAGLTFCLACRLFGWVAGLLAAIVVAVSGSQLIYERYLMTEALFGFTLVLASLALVWALGAKGHAETRGRGPEETSRVAESRGVGGEVLTRPRGTRGAEPLLAAAVAGLAIGLAALTRPVAQAILPLFVLALLVSLPRWRPALKAIGLMLVCYAVISAPWMARNMMVHETLTASGGLGRSLIARTVKYDSLFDWKWLSETYGGRDDLAARERMLLYRKRGNIPDSRSVRPYQDALVKELGLSQGQAEAAMREIALEAIARQPFEYVKGSLLFTGQILLGREERLQSHWRQRANKDWDEQWDDRLDFLAAPLTPRQIESQGAATALTERLQPSGLAWPLGVLALLGCLAAIRATGSRPALLLVGITLALVALSAFLDGPVPRYRYPLDPLIVVLAAGGAVALGRAVFALAHRLLIPLSERRAVRSAES